VRAYYEVPAEVSKAERVQVMKGMDEAIALRTLAEKHARQHRVSLFKAVVAVLETEEGRALKARHDGALA